LDEEEIKFEESEIEIIPLQLRKELAFKRGYIKEGVID